MNSYRLFIYMCLLVFVPLTHSQAGDDPKKKTGPPMVEGLKALKHPDAKVRYRAVQTLIELGPLAKFAVPDLREMLTDKHPQVRVKAAEALWKIDKTPSVVLLPVLLQALKDKDKSARAAAAPVIALLGAKAKAAVPALLGALKDKELDVKLAAVAALGDLGPAAKESAGALLDLTRDKDFFLLEPFVGAALTNLGDGTIPILTKGLADELPERRRVSAYALGSMGAKAAPAAGALAKALQSDDPSTRMLAARALGKIGPEAKSTLPALEKTLNDKSASVRIEAVLATWFITGEAKPIFVLVECLSDESTGVRENACHALGIMKSAARDAVEPVAKLLKDKELRVRAIMTLGEIGPDAAKTLPELKRLMQDKDGDTQLWSAFAVWQISGETKETMKVLEELLGTEAHYTPTINVLGAMGPAAESMLPTLVNLYREEDVAADRQALANAIKRIDPAAAKKLGIK